jgi:hypothetical protein
VCFVDDCPPRPEGFPAEEIVQYSGADCLPELECFPTEESALEVCFVADYPPRPEGFPTEETAPQHKAGSFPILPCLALSIVGSQWQSQLSAPTQLV